VHDAPMHGRVTIAAVGTTMFQRRLKTVPDQSFHALLDVVRTADAAFFNLEAPIREAWSYPVKQYVHTSYVTAEPWVAQELRWAGFNLASLANNHMSDWSPESISTNQRLLDAAGIAHSGAGATLSEARAPAYLDTARGRVGLISVDSSYEYGQFPDVQMASDPHGSVPGRPGTNGLRWNTYYELDSTSFEALRRVHESLGLNRQGLETAHIRPEPTDDFFQFGGVNVVRGDSPRMRTACRGSDVDEILRWVRSTRAQVDYLLVSHHNHAAVGEEWELPADFAVEFAHAAVDAGADAYIGHGYTPKGIEIYRDRPIFYDLGDWATQDAAARRHPGDAYERWGLDPKATPGDFADARERAWSEVRESSENGEFRALVNAYKAALNQSALVRFAFVDGELEGIELYPSVPSTNVARHRRGLPLLSTGKAAIGVLRRCACASRPFGTEIEKRDGIGHVRLR
jgi:poly-gamma-glutamate capsule biosynthesis protein CapA/YwtB (metallophosphatase superfamily)